jgi:hypothetical protein
MRQLHWEGNTPRRHIVDRVFSRDGSGREMMMYGTVTMQLRKEDVVLDWAGHMTLEEVEGSLRVKEYQVYAVGIILQGLTK